MSNDNLIKQKIDGWDTYENNLNCLSSKEFAQFLITTSKVRMTNEDLKAFVDNESKPTSVRRELIEFFSKSSGSVLDVFCGDGKNLILCSDMDRHVVGIDHDSLKVNSYLNLVSLDAFLQESELLNLDARAGVKHLKDVNQKFDLILIDPPTLKKAKKGSTDVGLLSPKEYGAYLENLISESAPLMRKSSHLIVLIQDFYFSGEYFMTPSLIKNTLPLKQKGIKIYFRDIDLKFIKNVKVYAPFQNHFYALIYTL